MQKSWLLHAVIVSFVCLATASAQAAADQATSTTRKSEATKKPKHLEDKVLDLVVPNTLVIEGHNTKVAPLTSGQKFGQVTKNFFNPFTFVGVGIEAGFDQAIDVHHMYGQGGKGYAKRYGADLADTATGQFFGVGVYPGVFHTDPRYYRMGRGGVVARGFYSVTRVLVTRTDFGRHVFNAPEILASATSSGISRIYYPSDERNVGDFAYSMGSRIAFDAAYNLAKEFWPDVRRRLFGSHK
jgi:hypothetical protein